MGHKYLDKIWANGKWKYIYKEVTPKNFIDKANLELNHKQIINSLPSGVKVVGNKMTKTVFGMKKKSFSNDILKQKNRKTLSESNRSKIKNKKLADFLTGLGVKVDTKDYKNRKYNQAADAAQRRGKEMTKKVNAQKVKPAIDAQQKRGKAQTEYYKKKMRPYYLRKRFERLMEGAKRLEKRQAEAKKERARRRNAEKRLAEYERSYNKQLPGSSYAPKTTKKKKKSSGNGWKKNLGMR